MVMVPPNPPYSSGTRIPKRSTSAIFFTMGQGNSPGHVVLRRNGTDLFVGDGPWPGLGWPVVLPSARSQARGRLLRLQLNAACGSLSGFGSVQSKGCCTHSFPSSNTKRSRFSGRIVPKELTSNLPERLRGSASCLQEGHQERGVQVDLRHVQLNARAPGGPGHAIPLGVEPLEGVHQVLQGQSGAFRRRGPEGHLTVEALNLRIDGQLGAARVGPSQGLMEIGVGPLNVDGATPSRL